MVTRPGNQKNSYTTAEHVRILYLAGGLQTPNVNLNDLAVHSKLVPFCAQHVNFE